MNLLEHFELIQKKFRPSGPPGSVENIFQIYERAGKDYLGNTIICLKLESEEKKSKSIN